MKRGNSSLILIIIVLFFIVVGVSAASYYYLKSQRGISQVILKKDKLQVSNSDEVSALEEELDATQTGSIETDLNELNSQSSSL